VNLQCFSRCEHVIGFIVMEQLDFPQTNIVGDTGKEKDSGQAIQMSMETVLHHGGPSFKSQVSKNNCLGLQHLYNGRGIELCL
jgi:hypothetical protein